MCIRDSPTLETQVVTTKQWAFVWPSTLHFHERWALGGLMHWYCLAYQEIIKGQKIFGWFDNFPRKAWPVALLKNVQSESPSPRAFSGHGALRDGHSYYCDSILQEQATIAIIRELKHATFFSQGWQLQLNILHKFLVSKETVVLRRWERSKQKFGFIKWVDKGEITTVKDLESWRFER